MFYHIDRNISRQGDMNILAMYNIYDRHKMWEKYILKVM